MPFTHIPDIPDWLARAWAGLGTALTASIIGRLMWHSQMVRLRRRSFFSVELVWELPTALGMGIIGRGCAEYFHLSGMASDALIVALAYLGPRGIEAFLSRWMERVTPPVLPQDQSKAEEENK